MSQVTQAVPDVPITRSYPSIRYRDHWRAWLGCLALAALFLAMPAAAKSEMVGKITLFDGLVEVSRDGQEWRPVRRSRLLFDGQYVRTGADSSVTILASDGGGSTQVGPLTTVSVGSDGVEALEGKVQSAVEEDGGLSGFFAALQRRFQRTERYATVRRGGLPHQVEVAESVTLTPQQRILVWQNAGPGHRYRLTIDGQAVTINEASPTAPYVQHDVGLLDPGPHFYRVEVLDERGNVRFADDDHGTIVFLSATENEALSRRVAEVMNDPTKDDFQIGEFLAAEGLLVQAMEHYQAFLADNPEEVEMRYALLKVYSELELDALRQAVAREYGLSAG